MTVGSDVRAFTGDAGNAGGRGQDRRVVTMVNRCEFYVGRKDSNA